jgi:hypothetical protein
LNNSRAISPVKKTGKDTPASATPIENRSNSVPRRSAESTPMETPPTSHSTDAPMASDSVTGMSLII